MQKLILFSAFLIVHGAAAQCPYFSSCPVNPAYCDSTDNDPLLWKAAPQTWNSQLMLSDLPEGDVALLMIARDSCGGANLSVEYTLFLDLDGNDTAETVIQSSALPPFGKVLYNNILSPNYALGDTLDFDQRAGLPDSMKYRFGLEIVYWGDSVAASLKWTTGIENLNYFEPKLPLGKHRIAWRIEQGGVEQICEFGFELRDCAPPVVKCENSLSVNIWQGGSITLWASDFLKPVSDNITDNITPQNLLRIGTRKLSDNGAGFPTDANGTPIVSVTFHCIEAWVNPVHHLVELWAIDKAGNVDSCRVDVSVADDFSFCNFDPTTLIVCGRTVSNEGIENVSCNVDFIDYQGVPLSLSELSSNIGCAWFVGDIPCGTDITVVPSRNDNPLNGVTTYDLVLISKHIIGTEPLNSPYKMIAADANKSGSITTFDIVELRKLILGIYDSMPNNQSWRFVEDKFLFPNPQNPFQTTLPDTIHIQDWECFFTQMEFIGIKVGDVNNTAVPNAVIPPPVENRDMHFLTLPELELQSGETVEIPIRATENAEWQGLQFGFDFDSELLDIESVESSMLPDFDQNNWAQPQAGRLALSWSAASPKRISAGDELLRLRIKARSGLQLSSILKTRDRSSLHPEAYDSEGTTHPLQLVFAEKNTSETASVFVPRPNPTSAGAMLPIQLSHAENLRLEILDPGGQLLWSNELTLEKGSHLLEIPAVAFPHLGVYLWRISAGEVSKSGKITRI